MGFFAHFSQMNANRISGSEARKIVAEQNATLVDVRSENEFGSGHAQGARNIPVQVLASRLEEIPGDRPVVVYCASGARSAAAAQFLTQAGYTVYDGGGFMNMLS